MEEKNIVIYGLGIRFEKLFLQDYDFVNMLKNLEYKISDFVDKGRSGQKIVFDSVEYDVISPFDINKEDSSRIIITSSKYYDEIKNELLAMGISESNIEFIDDFTKNCIKKMVHMDLFLNHKGVEIGGPSDLFASIYEMCASCDGVNYNDDTIWWKKNTEKYEYKDDLLGKVLIADATDLGIIPDDSYDFVISSNNLEHIANPIKAVKEFKRIAKNKGAIMIVVPIKERTFDHNRENTSFQHMLNDFLNDIGEDDLSHLSEILELHDYEMDPACGGKEAFELRSKDNIRNRCLHQHVFDESGLREIFNYVGIDIINFFSLLGNYWIIGTK